MRYSQSSIQNTYESTGRTSTTTTTPTIPIATIRSNQYTNTSSLSITIPPYMKHQSNNDDDNDTTTTFPYPSLLHTIHVTNVLSPAEVQQCLLLARQYAQQTNCWDTPDFDRHASYATCDFPIDDCIPLQQYLDDDTIQFDNRIFQLLQTFFHVPMEQMYYIDLFCAQYTAATTATTTTMDRLGSHRDGSILSFTITLTEPNIDFIGGGTFFEALQNVTTSTTPTTVTMDDTTLDHSNSTKATNIMNAIENVFQNGTVRPQQSGDGVFHCGKLLHGGSPITSGTRIVLVGFVDVVRVSENDHSIVRPDRIHTACRDWGRLDVATYQYQRQRQQQSLTFSQPSNPNKYIRSERSKRWIPIRHCLRNIRPLYLQHSTKVGKDIILQRQRRLEIEDQLLRSVLLQSSSSSVDDDTQNRRTSKQKWGGLVDDDITIL